MSHTRRPSILLAAGLLVIALATPSAHASGRDLWIECRDTGTVGANHSPQDYEDAIANAPGDGAEYSPCLAAIRAGQQQAALRAAGGTPQVDGDPDRKGSRDGSRSPAGAARGTADRPDAGTAASPAAGVAPQALGDALAAEQLDPSDYPGASPERTPSASTTADTPLQLGSVPESTIDRSLSLPLPIAALAILGLLWGVELAGRIVTRFKRRA